MNVLITNDWIGKIADFGLSKAFQPQPSVSRSRVGTTRSLFLSLPSSCFRLFSFFGLFIAILFIFVGGLLLKS